MNTTVKSDKIINHILYHGGYCQDGFMAAFLMKGFLECLGLPVVTTAVNYNEPMPDVTGQTVLIVDFSYSPEVIQEARKTAETICMFDHHEKAAKMWGGYGEIYHEDTDDLCGFMGMLVEAESGAMIVYNFLHDVTSCKDSSFVGTGIPLLKIDMARSFINNVRLTKIVRRIDDRDRWVFNYEDTNIYRSVLSGIPMDFEAWEKLIFETTSQNFDELLDKALHYSEKEEQICQAIAKHMELVKLGDYTVPAVNCPAQFGSRVGEIIGKDHPFSLTYALNSKIVYCSLRSNPDNGIDVSAFASKYNGGGHIHAAGFRLTPAQLVDLLDGKL